MDEQQKERLKQELRFLEESLEADVISRDEYERGKERIERKLKELEETPAEVKEQPPVEEKKPEEETPEEETPEEEKKEEPIVEEKEKVKEEPQPEIEIKEIKEQPTKIIGAEAEKPEEEKKEEPTEETKEPEEKPEEKEKKSSKKWLYWTIILLIAVILFFSIRGCNKSEDQEIIDEFIPPCSSDSDCNQQGMIGICLNPDTKEAKCEFKQDAETNLIVINDKDCKLCHTSNTKTIVKEIFPNAKITEIDYETEEAQKLVNDLGIDALPAYIFDSNVKEALNFNDFKTALIKKKDSYIITNTASGAVYYFKRALIKNKLDLYTLPDTNGKMESSIQEVLNLFKDKINFTKHIVTERQKDFLEKELAINTYPAFLLNNQVKFRGILPADMIKEKICQVSYFKECTKELSKI